MAQADGYRRVIRSLRLMDEHRAEVEEVAENLQRRGLQELADKLRASLSKLPSR